jgi:predicted nucleic acid-binding protein
MTRKEIIIENYLILKLALEEFIDGSLFPSLSDYEITDIVYYLNLYFPKNGEEEYINTIEKLMNQKGIQINDNDFTTVTNLILDFINFLNNI